MKFLLINSKGEVLDVLACVPADWRGTDCEGWIDLSLASPSFLEYLNEMGFPDDNYRAQRI